MKRKTTGRDRTAKLTAKELSRRLRRAADPVRARVLQKFFKTGPGQYAAGDLFLGLAAPETRALVREFRNLKPRNVLTLVRSPFHEERLAGLLLWVDAFERGDPATRAEIFDLYCRNRAHINNWDLVDLSAPQIVGGSLAPADNEILQEWIKSPVVWDRRIAVLATFNFIREGRFKPTLALCRKLFNDPHDLMHKACGWMLREIGKRDRVVLTAFLDRHASHMPRTMLRYALEHYPEHHRSEFMNRPRSSQPRQKHPA